jgi:hypothetical protein
MSQSVTKSEISLGRLLRSWGDCQLLLLELPPEKNGIKIK